MAITAASLNKVFRSKFCKKKQAVLKAYWGQVGDLDLANIPTSPSPEGNSIIANGLPMIAAGVMYPLNIDSEKSDLTATYNNDNGYYEWSLVLDYGGFDADSIQALCDAQEVCDIFVWLELEGCKEVVLGFSYVGGEFINNYRGEITDHTISIGTSNDSSNSITIGGKSQCAFVCAEIGVDNLIVCPDA